MSHATARQMAANFANAQKSTGPRTDAGKAASSQNALRHGLTSAKPFVPKDLEPDYADMCAELRDYIKPSGPVEETLFEQLILASWNLKRIPNLMLDLADLDPTIDPLLNEAIRPQYDRFQRYLNMWQVSYIRSVRMLRKTQTDRVNSKDAHPAAQTKAPETAAPSPVTPSPDCPKPATPTHATPTHAAPKPAESPRTSPFPPVRTPTTAQGKALEAKWQQIKKMCCNP